MNINKNEFIAWEYVDVNVKRNNATLYTDSYENFGWILIEQCEINYAPNVSVSNVQLSDYTPTSTTRNENEIVKLKFKRDSKLPNRIELDQLQQKCEEALSSVQKLEDKKAAHFMGPIIGFGIVGALFLILSILNFVSANIILCVLSAVFSIIGWVAAYVAFAKVYPKKNAKFNPRINEQFETIYRTCEQANALLA